MLQQQGDALLYDPAGKVRLWRQLFNFLSKPQTMSTEMKYSPLVWQNMVRSVRYDFYVGTFCTMQDMTFSTLMLSRSQDSFEILEQNEKQSYVFPFCSNISFIFYFLHTLTLQFSANCLREQEKMAKINLLFGKRKVGDFLFAFLLQCYSLVWNFVQTVISLINKI